MTRRRAGIAAAALLALIAIGATGCAPSGGGANASPVATTSVDLPTSYRFAPAAITVVAGSTVTWTNHDNFTHSVRFPDGGEPLVMAPGESVERAFAAAGTFQYDCSFHPQNMKGSVLVTGT